MNSYDFGEQLRVGQGGERLLDCLFGELNAIEPATHDEQRQGIDRWFTRPNGKRVAVEYKTDSRAAKTGNAFVETVSVDTENKPGWAFTSRTDWLMYYVPGDELVYVIRMARLRRRVSGWQRRYRTVRVPNKGYSTHGVLVPLAEFEAIAQEVVNLADVPVNGQAQLALWGDDDEE